ncbi:MAG: ABC transporter ATP-binding protein [Nanohaloarchaea archaeon]|nr:ABC transporter ATP-binding protein [Candidatus Nanohaloarchaea archaeon]
MATIELEGVEKSYGSHEVLKGVSFEVEKGEIFGLLGPNGVGKTTLFQTVLGLLKQDAGKIRIDGEKHDRGKEIKRKIGYLPSDISFYESMTARQNLEFFAGLADTDPEIDDLLELVGLSDDAERDVKGFSTGMKKRLGIAQSLIKDPEIIIYDEPTTGLDPEGKRNFRRHVEKINDEKGKTVVISSHITTEIEPLCDRFGVLFDGEIVASGTKAELSSETGEGINLHIEAEDSEKLEKVLESNDYTYRSKRDAFILEIEKNKRSNVFDTLNQNHISVTRFDLEEETLETAYLKLTGGA